MAFVTLSNIDSNIGQLLNGGIAGNELSLGWAASFRKFRMDAMDSLRSEAHETSGQLSMWTYSTDSLIRVMMAEGHDVASFVEPHVRKYFTKLDRYVPRGG